MVYVIEDKGCYGLTKGQFSATANRGSMAKSGIANELPPIDSCGLAVQMGATFVARSFSGDKKQLQSILKAALSHKGTAVIDVVSPCVTFNDHVGSTKSYKYVRDNKIPLQSIGFVPHFEEIEVEEEFAPGSVMEVEMHDGSRLRLEKLEEEYDPTDRLKALERVELGLERGQIVTGVLYVNTETPSFTDLLNLDEQPLAQIGQDRLRPSQGALDEVMTELA